MNKLKAKPIDIANAAIAEVYGEQAVVLLTLSSTLNNNGKKIVLDWANDYNKIPKYTNLDEQSEEAQKGV